MARVSVISAFPGSPSSSDALEWHFPPDIESEITTLAAWCQVKQQQREPLSSVEDGVDNMDGRLMMKSVPIFSLHYPSMATPVLRKTSSTDLQSYFATTKILH